MKQDPERPGRGEAEEPSKAVVFQGWAAGHTGNRAELPFVFHRRAEREAVAGPGG